METMIGTEAGVRLPRGAREEILAVEPFSKTLAVHRLELRRGATTTLQINVGLRCNQGCHHCHLEAGPHREEMMSWGTAQEVIRFAGRGAFETIDLTGGSPEMHPGLLPMIEKLAPFARRIMLRCNLTILAEEKTGRFIGGLQSASGCARGLVSISECLPDRSSERPDSEEPCHPEEIE